MINRKFLVKWLDKSTYFFMIFSAVNYLSKSFKSNNVLDLVIILLGCLFVGFVFSYFSQKRNGI